MASSFFNLALLNGSNGFTVDGLSAKYDLGRSVSSAGDINGDGIDDLLIGADCTGNGESIAQPGFSYVIFGKTGSFSASVGLNSLNGSNGFVIRGIAPDDSTGCAVSGIGDINGDGVDDLAIGARFSDIKGQNSGRAYVVYGQRSTFPTTLELSTINGSNGFEINGIAADDRFGRSVSKAGDINGDGIQDFLIGARLANPDDKRNAGQSYVVFGRSNNFPTSFDITTLNGSNGFAIDGLANGDDLGFSVSSAGDLNGDGFEDLVIGALGADGNGKQNAGQTYVIFGKAGGFSSRFNLSTLNGSNGFTINGLAANDNLGQSACTAGDINGDGIDDLVLGAPEADPNGNANAGQSYVIFGQRGFNAQFDLSSLNGSNGFTINGLAAGNLLGSDVSDVGDVNNDGIDDFAIGAPGADVDGKNDAGQVYLVFGRRGGFSNLLDLANLGENEGLIFNGKVAEDEIGRSINAAGDLNNDGIDDLVIGVYTAEPTGFHSGQVYVVYGGPTLKGEKAATDGLKLTPPLIDASGVTSCSMTVNLASTALTINAATPSKQTVTGYRDVIGTSFDDRIIGDDQSNSLAGNAGNDSLQAGNGDDILSGDAGDDALNGGEGQDRYLFDADNPLGSDTLTDSGGTDTLDFSATTTQAVALNLNLSTGQALNPNHTLTLSRSSTFEHAIGGALGDSLLGNGGSNTLVGNDGNDRLLGGLKSDVLQGGSGNDTLAGNADKDQVTGGLGKDRFVFDLGARFSRVAMGVDQITDFARKQDKIVLDRTTFRTLKKGRLKSFDTAKSIGEAKRSSDQIVYVRKTGNIFYNANREAAGFGAGSLFADVKNGLNLTAKDFTVQI